MMGESSSKPVGIEWRIGRTAITRHGYDRIDRATAAHAADLVEPGSVERVACLLRIEQHRVVGNQVAGFDKTWRQALDKRLIANDKQPAVTIAPPGSVAVSHCVR